MESTSTIQLLSFSTPQFFFECNFLQKFCFQNFSFLGFLSWIRLKLSNPISATVVLSFFVSLFKQNFLQKFISVNCCFPCFWIVFNWSYPLCFLLCNCWVFLLFFFLLQKLFPEVLLHIATSRTSFHCQVLLSLLCVVLPGTRPVVSPFLICRNMISVGSSHCLWKQNYICVNWFQLQSPKKWILSQVTQGQIFTHLRVTFLFWSNPHRTRARKFEWKPFDVACVQCEHSYSRTQVPFARVALRVASRVPRPVWMRPLSQVRRKDFASPNHHQEKNPSSWSTLCQTPKRKNKDRSVLLTNQVVSDLASKCWS